MEPSGRPPGRRPGPARARGPARPRRSRGAARRPAGRRPRARCEPRPRYRPSRRAPSTCSGPLETSRTTVRPFSSCESSGGEVPIARPRRTVSESSSRTSTSKPASSSAPLRIALALRPRRQGRSPPRARGDDDRHRRALVGLLARLRPLRGHAVARDAVVDDRLDVHLEARVLKPLRGDGGAVADHVGHGLLLAAGAAGRRRRPGRRARARPAATATAAASAGPRARAPRTARPASGRARAAPRAPPPRSARPAPPPARR